jgi:hypothetical protein
MSISSYIEWFNTGQRIDDFKSQSIELELQWDRYFLFNHANEVTSSIAAALKTFKQFKESDILSANKLILTKSVYEEYFYELHGASALTALYTSSVQQESHDYLTKCYIAPNITASVSYTIAGGNVSSLRRIQEIRSKEEYRLLDIAYGNYHGSGSLDGNLIIYDDATQNYDLSYPTKAIYYSLKQNTVFNNDQVSSKIKILDETDSVFALNIGSNYLFDGISNNASFELKLAKMNGSESINDLTHQYKITSVTSNNAIDPNNTRDLFYDREVYSFIELSKKATQISTPELFDFIVSGSLEDGVHYENDLPVIYGKIYYDSGLVIFDADKLDTLLNLNLQTGSNINSNNSMRLYKSISASLATIAILADGNLDIENPYYPDIQTTILGQQTGTITTPKFDIKQELNSIFYKCFIGTEEYNYSNNPSYYDGKSGELRIRKFYSGSSDFYIKPETYITSIGLYDAGYNLLAVAKISKPVRKSFDNSIIINVRLDY